MKKLYLFIFLLCFQVETFAQLQIIPCEFTWRAIKLPNGAMADYTSPQLLAQPYQGPCMAFALVAALESQYEIDHNRPNRNLNLSEAYIDYKVNSWDNNNLLNVFSGNKAIPEQAAGNFTEHCNNEQACDLIGPVTDCLDLGQCFEVIDTWREPGNYWDQTVQCKTCPSGMKWARGSGVQLINNNINNINDFKTKLMYDGPMILKLNGHQNTNTFYSYGAGSSLSFHAVTVIGWKEVSGGLQLHFKDSWPNSAGFKYSNVLTHSQLVSLIDDGETPGYGFELFQVRNAHVVGEKVPYINFSYFSPADQCPKVTVPLLPPAIHAVFLNRPAIIRNQLTTVTATLNCNGEPAVDWDWSIPSSGLHPVTMNPCNSSLTFSTNTPANSMEIKVRAKGANGLWSAWTSRTFMVTNNQFE